MSMPYPRAQKPIPDAGGDYYTQQTRDEYTIPQKLTNLHTIIPYYLASAEMYESIKDKNDDAVRLENEKRFKAVELFMAMVNISYILPDVETKLSNSTGDILPKTGDELIQMLSHYQGKIKSKDLSRMYRAYAKILNETGLLTAYDMRPTNKNKFYHA
jgi:hypothetical protein